MTDNNRSLSIGLIREVFSSEFTPQLFAWPHARAGASPRRAARAAHRGRRLLEAIITGALPETYSGDTLRELPEMIAGARKKGFDKAAPTSPSSR